MSKPDRIHFFFWDWRATLLMSMCLALFFGNLGAPFYDKQEPREALVVWEINHSGNWILPLREGHEIPSKPPLYHWLAAIVSQTAHQLNEMTARLPSALLGALGVLLVYWAGASLWSRNAGFVSGSILATSIEWRGTAKVARVDMTLTFALLCAFLFFLYFYRSGGGRNKAFVLGLLLGLATLAKGPLGFVVPCLTYLVFLWAQRDLSFIKKLHPLVVVSTCAVVAGSWYALALWQGGETFLDVVIKENFSMTMGQEAGHPHPFYSYVPFLFQNMAPWSIFFLPLGLWVYRSRRNLTPDLTYLLIWFGTVFIFFSAFTQKRPVYILPAYPALALLLGTWWQKAKDNGAPSLNELARPAVYFCATTFLLFSGVLFFQILGRGIAPFIRPILHPKDQAQFSVVASLLLKHRLAVLFWAAVCGLGGVFLIIAARKDAWYPAFGCITALMVVSLLFVQTFDVYVARQYSFKSFVKDVVGRVNDAPLYFYSSKDYGVEFYADRYIPILTPDALEMRAIPYYILVWENDWKEFPIRNALSLLGRSDSIDPMRKGRLLLVGPANHSPIKHSNLPDGMCSRPQVIYRCRCSSSFQAMPLGIAAQRLFLFGVR
jgi:4-amino-4-deoxy-L-arabinose transferase-like glycosyltransferase